jgi:hypothetical protein
MDLNKMGGPRLRLSGPENNKKGHYSAVINAEVNTGFHKIRSIYYMY